MTALHKTLNPINAKFERKAFYDASLQLVKEGKFQAMSVIDIAFMARISERAIPFIFESRAQLVAHLVEHVTSEINVTIETSLKEAGSFKENFFNVWFALYNHYVSNPNVIAFVEQFDNLNKSNNVSVHPGFTDALVDLFRHTSPDIIKSINPETLAYLYHENVLTAAKMKLSKLFTDINFDAAQLPSLLWASICSDQVKN